MKNRYNARGTVSQVKRHCKGKGLSTDLVTGVSTSKALLMLRMAASAWGRKVAEGELMMHSWSITQTAGLHLSILLIHIDTEDAARCEVEKTNNGIELLEQKPSLDSRTWM